MRNKHPQRAESSSRHAGWWVSYPCIFHSAEVITSPRLSGDKIRRSKAVRFQPKTPGSRAEVKLQVCSLETSLNLTGNQWRWFPVQTVNKDQVKLTTPQGWKHWGKYLAVIGVRVISVIWGSSVSVRLNSREHKYRDDLIWWYNSSTDGE